MPNNVGVRRTLIGPRTETLHIKVSEETLIEIRARAHQADRSIADVAATQLELVNHGRAVVRRIQDAALEIVSGECQIPTPPDYQQKESK